MHFAEGARRHRGGNAAKAAPCASCYQGECDCGGKDSFCDWFHLSFLLSSTQCFLIRWLAQCAAYQQELPLLPTAAHHATEQKFSSPCFCSCFVALQEISGVVPQ